MSEVLRAGEEALITFIDYTAAFDSLSHRFLDESLAEANVSPKVRRIIQAIYSSASGVVRIRDASGENVFSGPFSIDRGAIQGDIYSPPAFTIGLDSIFRRHDIICEGVGGSGVQGSKFDQVSVSFFFRFFSTFFPNFGAKNVQKWAKNGQNSKKIWVKTGS